LAQRKIHRPTDQEQQVLESHRCKPRAVAHFAVLPPAIAPVSRDDTVVPLAAGKPRHGGADQEVPAAGEDRGGCLPAAPEAREVG
jgi:hypothetical protein